MASCRPGLRYGFNARNKQACRSSGGGGVSLPFSVCPASKGANERIIAAASMAGGGEWFSEAAGDVGGEEVSSASASDRSEEDGAAGEGVGSDGGEVCGVPFNTEATVAISCGLARICSMARESSGGAF